MANSVTDDRPYPLTKTELLECDIEAVIGPDIKGTIKYLQGMAEKFGFDAKLDIQYYDYDGVECITVKNTRLETPAEVKDRLKRVDMLKARLAKKEAKERELLASLKEKYE